MRITDEECLKAVKDKFQLTNADVKVGKKENKAWHTVREYEAGVHTYQVITDLHDEKITEIFRKENR